MTTYAQTVIVYDCHIYVSFKKNNRLFIPKLSLHVCFVENIDCENRITVITT